MIFPTTGTEGGLKQMVVGFYTVHVMHTAVQKRTITLQYLSERMKSTETYAVLVLVGSFLLFSIYCCNNPKKKLKIQPSLEQSSNLKRYHVIAGHLYSKEFT